MGKIYLDATEMQKRHIMNVLLVEDQDVISAGTTISSIPIEFKKDYRKYSDNYDIHFIFDDAIPAIEFYTVPQVDIIAKDSVGGYIGAIGQLFDINSDAPICYISKEFECFMIAKNGKEFLQHIEAWNSNLQPFYKKITFYTSAAEAKKELEFIALPKGIVEEVFKKQMLN